MKEGYWANYETGKSFLIDEHERWIRRDGNADKLGVPAPIIENAIAKYKPQMDRDRFLKHLMQHAPIMRIRGHGDMVTFEYSSESDTAPRELIRKLGQKWFGPYMIVNIYNFNNNTHTQHQWMTDKIYKNTQEGE